MYLYVPVDEFDKFTASITEATSARALVTPGENTLQSEDDYDYS